VSLTCALALLACVLVLSGAAAEAAPDFSATLALEVPQKGGAAHVRFTLTNQSSATLHLLIWNTPFDPVLGNIFEITRDGTPVKYVGKLVKRGKPGKADYLALAPGETQRKVVDLARFYDVSAAGHYVVSLVRGLRYKKDGIESAAPHVVFRSSAKLTVAFDQRGSDVGAAPTFEHCSEGQKNDIRAAQGFGLTYASDATTYLGAHAADNPGERYTTWFGTVSAPRYTRVSDNFTRIRNTIRDRTLNFDCSLAGCEDDWFAYVIPDEPYTIHLCNAFWAAEPSGDDSRGGTVVHEVSHFDVVAGTDDDATGRDDCLEFARADPNGATRNADNYEYFAEPQPQPEDPEDGGTDKKWELAIAQVSEGAPQYCPRLSQEAKEGRCGREACDLAKRQAQERLVRALKGSPSDCKHYIEVAEKCTPSKACRH
jgi:peptidyl-Lys metalloendopeptidase